MEGMRTGGLPRLLLLSYFNIACVQAAPLARQVSPMAALALLHIRMVVSMHARMRTGATACNECSCSPRANNLRH